MAIGYGQRGHLMWDFQNSYGTSKVDSLEAIPIISESVVHTIEQLVEQNMYARLAESPRHEGMHGVAGSIEMESHPIAMGFPLKAALGQVTTTSDTAKQVHVFQPVAADFDGRAAVPPSTLEFHRDQGSAGLYFDMLADTLRLNIANGQLLSLSTAMIGAGFTRQAAGSPTFAPGKPFQWAQFSGSLGGIGILDIRNLQLEFNNQLEARHTLQNCRTPYRIKRTGPQLVELSGTLEFAQHSYWDALLDQSEIPFIAHFTGAESPTSLKIDVPAFRFKTFEPGIAGPGIVEAVFTAQGVFHTGSNTALEITLENTREFY